MSLVIFLVVLLACCAGLIVHGNAIIREANERQHAEHLRRMERLTSDEKVS